jgi:tRNA wybutosine-synthesizing protein 1
MEMTPSLACANKCVFCWRHHKNPVGTSWRWKVDSPEFLIESAIMHHQNMVKELKGVPGVQLDRHEEASQIRHCALSLVGEPIIYPYINKFIDLLHERKISSFMVTNAQFPDKIDQLQPVTQLYISVDAATKESLRKIDRPLFEDFWERMMGSIDSLSKKGQRTVFRLTLVKEWNVEEIDNYAQLIKRGMPDFIEIKGVTYCGTSKASTLRMTNVPYHQEVRGFSQKLIEMGLSEFYELACEHAHSCCTLIARKDKFKVNGEWHTWIDYDRFHELSRNLREAREKLESNEISTQEFKKYWFTSTDYMVKTPSWAVFGSQEAGFDPVETRFFRNKQKVSSSS